MRPIEFNGIIGRTTDASGMKHSEDSKPMADQQNMMLTGERHLETEAHQVNEQQNTEMNNFDAKQGSKGQYEGQNDKKRRKKEADGVVKIKTAARFDIKI